MSFHRNSRNPLKHLTVELFRFCTKGQYFERIQKLINCEMLQFVTNLADVHYHNHLDPTTQFQQV